MMSHKPRKKRLAPAEVRTKLAAEEAQRLQKQERLASKEKRERESAALILPLFTKLHAGVRAAADVNPVYRPLVGENWYETLKLFDEHLKSLTGSNRSELLTRAFQDVGMWDAEDLMSVIKLFKFAHDQ